MWFGSSCPSQKLYPAIIPGDQLHVNPVMTEKMAEKKVEILHESACNTTTCRPVVADQPGKLMFTLTQHAAYTDDEGFHPRWAKAATLLPPTESGAIDQLAPELPSSCDSLRVPRSPLSRIFSIGLLNRCLETVLKCPLAYRPPRLVPRRAR